MFKVSFIYTYINKQIDVQIDSYIKLMDKDIKIMVEVNYTCTLLS